MTPRACDAAWLARTVGPSAPRGTRLVTAPSSADLAEMPAPREVPNAAAPNLDSSMRPAPDDFALVLHALLLRLREMEPDIERDELRELVDAADTIEGANQAEARTRATFDVVASLRRRVEASGVALHEYLVRWPEEERMKRSAFESFSSESDRVAP